MEAGKEIELRSEEVQEVMGQILDWIVWWGSRSCLSWCWHFWWEAIPLAVVENSARMEDVFRMKRIVNVYNDMYATEIFMYDQEGYCLLLFHEKMRSG